MPKKGERELKRPEQEAGSLADSRPQQTALSDADVLNWIADRLVFVYGESPHVDFVLRLREIEERLRAVIDPDAESRPLE